MTVSGFLGFQFHGFIKPATFKRYFPKAKSLIETDSLGAERLPFWNWLYERL